MKNGASKLCMKHLPHGRKMWKKVNMCYVQVGANLDYFGILG